MGGFPTKGMRFCVIWVFVSARPLSQSYHGYVNPTPNLGVPLTSHEIITMWWLKPTCSKKITPIPGKMIQFDGSHIFFK